jgi:phospholipid/cholesterol/gamma-HCH transport system ATP-binding protein
MIEVTHVSLTLGDHAILRNVSVFVPQGSTTVILGGSGSGKTTLLRLMLGLYKPTSGSIRVDGIDITHYSERELTAVRQRMGMVFQGAALFDSLTVRENVGYRLWEHRLLPEAEIHRTVEDNLRFVGLADAIDKMPAELSGGMRKRVGIARALASGASILLYDEPTAGLDPVNTFAIGQLITRLKTKGVTQVVVTHDLETAYRVADRIVLVEEGRVLFDGTPDALRAVQDPTVRGFLDPAGAVGAST